MMIAVILGGWVIILVIAALLAPWHAKRGKRSR
ncbi:hypothetical protein MMA231_03597 (plasmid) [Asticcacaulis sp. MM231]